MKKQLKNNLRRIIFTQLLLRLKKSDEKNIIFYKTISYNKVIFNDKILKEIENEILQKTNGKELYICFIPNGGYICIKVQFIKK